MEELEELSEDLGTVMIDRTASSERFKSLKACFGYTINKLDKALRELLPKLIYCHAPSLSRCIDLAASKNSK